MEKEISEEFLGAVRGSWGAGHRARGSLHAWNLQNSPKRCGLRAAHLPERQDEQGQEQETSEGASQDDPDGNLRLLGLGDLKCDLGGEKKTTADSRQGWSGKGDSGNAEHPFLWECCTKDLAQFSLRNPAIPGLELGSGHACPEFLQTSALSLGHSSPSVIHRDFPSGIRAGCGSIPKLWIPQSGTHLAAGILFPENEGAPEAPLESGVHGELQCLELQLHGEGWDEHPTRKRSPHSQWDPSQ